MRIIGMIIIIIGALPFLTKIPQIGAAIDKYKFIAAIVPGSIIYQLIIIILGILLIWQVRHRVSVGTAK